MASLVLLHTSQTAAGQPAVLNYLVLSSAEFRGITGKNEKFFQTVFTSAALVHGRSQMNFLYQRLLKHTFAALSRMLTHCGSLDPSLSALQLIRGILVGRREFNNTMYILWHPKNIQHQHINILPDHLSRENENMDWIDGDHSPCCW